MSFHASYSFVLGVSVVLTMLVSVENVIGDVHWSFMLAIAKTFKLWSSQASIGVGTETRFDTTSAYREPSPSMCTPVQASGSARSTTSSRPSRKVVHGSHV